MFYTRCRVFSLENRVDTPAVVCSLFTGAYRQFVGVSYTLQRMRWRSECKTLTV